MARVAAVARILCSLLATTAVIGGTAAALLWWAGWPLPQHWPTAGQWAAFAGDPLTYPAIKTALAVAGWLLWLLLVVSVGVESWARLSHRPPPLRLPRPMRVLAAGLLGTGVLAVAAPVHPATPTAATTPMTPGHQAARPDIGSSTSTSHPAPPPQPGPHTNPATAAPADGADADRTAQICRGIDVPGGWIAWPLAAGILAATAVALLRRQARSPTALLRTIRAARHPAIDPTAPEQPPAALDDLAALEHDAASTATLTFGLHEGIPIGIEDLPATGVGLTGPGRGDALRGVLAAAAATADAGIVIPRDLLTDLTDLTGPAIAHIDLPRLTVTADTHTALHAIQLEIHRRYTTGNPPNAASVATGHPPLILLTNPAQPRRLTALAELGHELSIRIIVAGPWTHGATWSMDQRGYATDNHTPIGRLNILNPAALAQLSYMLQPTTTNPPAAPTPRPPTTSPSPPFHLNILGPPALATPTAPAAHIRRSGSRQICVYLALHPDGATRADLLDNIFGHMKLSTAATSLNSCLYELKRILTTNDRSALQRVDDSYRLDPQLITVDWWQLQHALRSGDLDHAIGLYTGPLADGHTWDWLPEHRQTARHLIADAHARLAHTAGTAGQALEHALAGIRIDPYAPTCYKTAINAHLLLGNTGHAQALRHEMTRRLTRASRQAG